MLLFEAWQNIHPPEQYQIRRLLLGEVIVSSQRDALFFQHLSHVLCSHLPRLKQDVLQGFLSQSYWRDFTPIMIIAFIHHQSNGNILTLGWTVFTFHMWSANDKTRQQIIKHNDMVPAINKARPPLDGWSVPIFCVSLFYLPLCFVVVPLVFCCCVFLFVSVLCFLICCCFFCSSLLYSYLPFWCILKFVVVFSDVLFAFCDLLLLFTLQGHRTLGIIFT